MNDRYSCSSGSESRTKVELKPCFSDPQLEVMNFLNEVVLDFPGAISFAPGRPLESLFDVRGHVAAIPGFIDAESSQKRISPESMWGQIGQYNRTNGMINEIVARQLVADEGIRVSAEAIMVTVGAQEAMAVILTGLFEPSRDILLVSDPTYIGITGLAQILGISVYPVPAGPQGMEPDMLRKSIGAASNRGRPRAVYDIPDFNNPVGVSLPLDRRFEILEICRQYDLLYLEDNPYGMFNYDDVRIPTLKSLDEHGVVLYIGSFAKTLFPGLRLGYLVADQQVGERTLAQEFSKVKSLITVNTPALCQVIAAAAIRGNGYSLEPVVAPKREQFRKNRDVMLESLAHEFSNLDGRVQWTRPQGGFFLTVTLPFPFAEPEVRECAAKFGVIVCPMQFFALGNDRRMQVRLSFSYVIEDEIREGVARFSRFCRSRL